MTRFQNRRSGRLSIAEIMGRALVVSEPGIERILPKSAAQWLSPPVRRTMLANSSEEVSVLANEMLRQGLKDVTSEPLPADPIVIKGPLETGSAVNLTANFTAILPNGAHIELPEGTTLREETPEDVARREAPQPCVITRPTPR